jgi:hypothetical protein
MVFLTGGGVRPCNTRGRFKQGSWEWPLADTIRTFGRRPHVGTVALARHCRWMNLPFDQSQGIRVGGSRPQRALSLLISVVGIGVVLGGIAIAASSRSNSLYRAVGIVGVLMGAFVIWVAWKAFFSALIVTSDAIVLRGVQAHSCPRNDVRAIYKYSGDRGIPEFALVRHDWSVGLTVTAMAFSRRNISQLAAVLGVPILGTFTLPLRYQLERDRDDAISAKQI